VASVVDPFPGSFYPGETGPASATEASVVPVTYRGVAEDNRGTGASAIVNKPTGVVEGDYLICVQTCDLNGSLAGMTAPSGWVERGSSSRSDVGFMKVWTKVAGPSEPTTYTFPDPGGAQDCAIILAATGQDPNSPIAAGPTFASGAASTSHPAPSVAGVANGLLVTAHAAGTGGTTRSYTPPSGMTERQESGASTGATIVLELNTLDLAAGGQTGTKTATCSGSAPYVTMSLVIAPVSTAVTASPDTPDAAGKANNATARSNSAAAAGRGSATGAANNPTVAGTSRTTATAGRGTATGKANNPSVSTSSTSATTVLAGLAGATGAAIGSNTGAAFGFQVITATPPGSGGVFPSDHLFPSDSLFPSDGGGAAPQTVTAIGIPSAEAVGSPVVTLANGPLFVQAAAINSAEAFGVPTVTTAAGPQDITAVGIGSAEAFGRPTVTPDVAAPPPAPHAEYFDTYFVDGVDLSTYTTQIEVGEGLQDTPGTVGDNVALPGMDGALEVFGAPGQPRRPDGQGRLTLDMWLIGVDPDTGELLDSASTAQAYQQRWDELVRMFHRRRVLVDHPRTDGTRRAQAHLVPGETMAPSNRSASPWFGRFRVSLTIPGAHWTDLTEVTTGPTALTTNGMLDLGLFATATAPCTELTITFGPGNNPRLSTSYGFVGYNGVIAAGRQLTINTATGELGSGSGQLWTPAYDNLIYSPGPRYFEVDPAEPLQAILTHTTGGAMTVEVSGKRRYRTS
jgi:hypothetical protein